MIQTESCHAARLTGVKLTNAISHTSHHITHVDRKSTPSSCPTGTMAPIYGGRPLRTLGRTMPNNMASQRSVLCLRSEPQPVNNTNKRPSLNQYLQNLVSGESSMRALLASSISKFLSAFSGHLTGMSTSMHRTRSRHPWPASARLVLDSKHSQRNGKNGMSAKLAGQSRRKARAAPPQQSLRRNNSVTTGPSESCCRAKTSNGLSISI